MNNLYELQRSDISRASAVMKSAFQDDPIFNVFAKQDSKNEKWLYALYEFPIRYSLRYGQVHAVSENLEGIIAWLPDNLADFTIWRLMGSGAIGVGFKIGIKTMMQMMPAFKPIEKDRKAFMKGKSCLYLQMLAVAAELQGRGFGGKLLNALIQESERRGSFIYLETETETNVSFYEKYSFKLVKKITLPVIDLPMWEMAREPTAAVSE